MESKFVTADPQFGIARILRPYKGFELLYQNQPATIQIMMTEVVHPPGGEALDPFAAEHKPGYDPNLVRGLSVPIGARVILWLPKLMPLSDPPIRYKWTFQWRLRNLFDYRQARIPYHYPKQGEGVRDTSVVPSQPRVVIPAANQTVIYNEEPQPTGVREPVAANMRIEDVTAGGDYPPSGTDFRGLPINPDGSKGAIQQGLMNPAANPFGIDGLAQAAFYQLHEMQAFGDELCVGLWRDDPDASGPGAAPNWDLYGVDTEVRNFLGTGDQGVTPDVGVYVLCGTAP